MPELPEVETVRRSLVPRLIGRRIERVEVRERRLREHLDPELLRDCARGRRIEALRRRAKYLILELEGGRALLVHLGMTGRLLLRDPSAPVEPHVHVVFGLQGGLELRFQDPRRFGLVGVVDRGGAARDRRLRGLGLEPLSRACSGKRLHRASRGLRKPVKNFLMDARRLAGVGNIYSSEALYLAGVRPSRPAGRLGLEAWERLARALKQVLRDAIRQGGTTIRDFRDSSGDAGDFQVYLRVYDKAGEPCRRCGTPIRRRVLAGRSSFYCPRCQR